LAAAAGCGGTAAALRIGIAAALNLLPSMCTDLIVPFIYVFIGLSAAELALGLGGLKKLRELSSWVCISLLKWTSGALTALLALSGCFSGAADAGKVKAARMVISGMIPMVGGAVSNASESLMNAAGILKTSVGSYAALAVMVMFLSPFLRIGAQYLLLRFSASLCGLFGVPSVTGIVERMTQALGMLLAMTGVVCLMTLFSFVICIQVTAI
jgi:stage III sporulation protein AE